MRTLLQAYATASMSATGQLGENLLFILDYALRLLRVAVMLSLWHVLFAAHASVGGLTLQTVLTYTLIAEVFAEQLAPHVELEMALWRGDIAMALLRPVSIFNQFTARMVGRWLPGLVLFTVPLWLCAPLLGVNALPADLRAGLLFVPSLVLSIAVGTALDFGFAALMLGLGLPVWAIRQVRAASTLLLSGALIPLALLPWGLGTWLALLPFAAQASAPLRIYTGTGDPVTLLALQCFWAIVTWAATIALWRRHQEKLVFYGG